MLWGGGGWVLNWRLSKIYCWGEGSHQKLNLAVYVSHFLFSGIFSFLWCFWTLIFDHSHFQIGTNHKHDKKKILNTDNNTIHCYLQYIDHQSSWESVQKMLISVRKVLLIFAHCTWQNPGLTSQWTTMYPRKVFTVWKVITRLLSQLMRDEWKLPFIFSAGTCGEEHGKLGARGNAWGQLPLIHAHNITWTQQHACNDSSRDFVYACMNYSQNIFLSSSCDQLLMLRLANKMDACDCFIRCTKYTFWRSLHYGSQVWL